MTWWKWLLSGAGIALGFVVVAALLLRGRRGDAVAQLSELAQRRAEASLSKVNSDHEKAAKLITKARELREQAEAEFAREGLSAEETAERFRRLGL